MMMPSKRRFLFLALFFCGLLLATHASTPSPPQASNSTAAEAPESESEHLAYEYEELLGVVGFLAGIWFLGWLFRQILLPELVGNVVAGVLLGPEMANITGRFATALSLAGELGFILMLLEGGLEVNVPLMKTLGYRAAGVAFVGQAVSTGVGTAIGIGLKLTPKSAFAAAAVLAPMSTSVVLAVFRQWNALSHPTGQLVLAAAVLDDIVSMIMLSELKALKDGTVTNIVVPIVSSLAYLLVLGGLALTVLPGFIRKQVLPRIPRRHRTTGTLLLVLTTAVGLATALNYSQASRYLGIFIAGLCFCQVHSVLETTWTPQMKRLQRWLLRIFFGASVAFEIKIKSMWTGVVWVRAAAYLPALVSKFVVALFATPLRDEWATLGTAMISRGEMSFVLNRLARSELGLIDEDTGNAIMLDVLIAIFTIPVALSLIFRYRERQRTRLAAKAGGAGAEVGAEGLLFYRVSMRVQHRFQLLDSVTSRLHRLHLAPLDLRLEYGPKYTTLDAFVSDRGSGITGEEAMELLTAQTEDPAPAPPPAPPPAGVTQDSTHGGRLRRLSSHLMSFGGGGGAAASPTGVALPEQPKTNGLSTQASMSPKDAGPKEPKSGAPGGQGGAAARLDEVRSKIEARLESLWTALEEIVQDDKESLDGSQDLRKRLGQAWAATGRPPPPVMRTAEVDRLLEDVEAGILVALWSPHLDAGYMLQDRHFHHHHHHHHHGSPPPTPLLLTSSSNGNLPPGTQTPGGAKPAAMPSPYRPRDIGPLPPSAIQALARSSLTSSALFRPSVAAGGASGSDLGEGRDREGGGMQRPSQKAMAESSSYASILALLTGSQDRPLASQSGAALSDMDQRVDVVIAADSGAPSDSMARRSARRLSARVSPQPQSFLDAEEEGGEATAENDAEGVPEGGNTPRLSRIFHLPISLFGGMWPERSRRSGRSAQDQEGVLSDTRDSGAEDSDAGSGSDTGRGRRRRRDGGAGGAESDADQLDPGRLGTGLFEGMNAKGSGAGHWGRRLKNRLLRRRKGRGGGDAEMGAVSGSPAQPSEAPSLAVAVQAGRGGTRVHADDAAMSSGGDPSLPHSPHAPSFAAPSFAALPHPNLAEWSADGHLPSLDGPTISSRGSSMFGGGAPDATSGLAARPLRTAAPVGGASFSFPSRPLLPSTASLQSELGLGADTEDLGRRASDAAAGLGVESLSDLTHPAQGSFSFGQHSSAPLTPPTQESATLRGSTALPGMGPSTRLHVSASNVPEHSLESIVETSLGPSDVPGTGPGAPSGLTAGVGTAAAQTQGHLSRRSLQMLLQLGQRPVLTSIREGELGEGEVGETEDPEGDKS